MQSSTTGINNPRSERCVREIPVPDTEEGRVGGAGMETSAPDELESGLTGEHGQ